MIVRFKASALLQTRWYEYVVRFALGGAMTVIAGLIAARFGPVIGGLFLAFPAIFPASTTLIEKHVRERKEKAGLRGGAPRQGRGSARRRRRRAGKFRARGVRSRDLAHDRAVPNLAPHPRGFRVVLRCNIRLAGMAMAQKVSGGQFLKKRSGHLARRSKHTALRVVRGYAFVRILRA
jgi:hypothetical protein